MNIQVPDAVRKQVAGWKAATVASREGESLRRVKTWLCGHGPVGEWVAGWRCEPGGSWVGDGTVSREVAFVTVDRSLTVTVGESVNVKSGDFEPFTWCVISIRATTPGDFQWFNPNRFMDAVAYLIGETP